jgi:hypothetical protein
MNNTELWQRITRLEGELLDCNTKRINLLDTVEAIYKLFPGLFERAQLPENGSRKPSELIQEELDKLQTPLVGDIPAQARGWIAVHEALKKAGLDSFLGSFPGHGIKRAVEFIQYLAKSLATAKAPLYEGTELKIFEGDTLHHISCEVSHDLYQGDFDRVRWNNRAMGMAIKTINYHKESIVKLEQELEDLKEEIRQAGMERNLQD